MTKLVLRIAAVFRRRRAVLRIVCGAAFRACMRDAADKIESVVGRDCRCAADFAMPDRAAADSLDGSAGRTAVPQKPLLIRFRCHPWRCSIRFGSPCQAVPAPRSARGVRSRREAVPRKRLVLTHGLAFGRPRGSAAEAATNSIPLPSMAIAYELRIARPGRSCPSQRSGRSLKARGGASQTPCSHPWPVVRQAARQCRASGLPHPSSRQRRRRMAP